MTTVQASDSTATAGGKASVTISLIPEGREVAGSFGIQYDRTVLEFEGASPGKDAPAGITIGFAKALGGFGMNFKVQGSQAFAKSATPLELIELTFKAKKAGASAINFTSSITPEIPTKKSIGTRTGGLVRAIKWMDGSVTVKQEIQNV